MNSLLDLTDKQLNNAIANAAYAIVDKCDTILTPEQAEPIVKAWLKDAVIRRLEDPDHFVFIEEITSRKDWSQAELNAENEMQEEAA